MGDEVRILFEGPPGEFEVVGLAGFGEEDSLFGATWALFDLPTAQAVLGKQGQLDSVSVVAEEGVSGVELQRGIAEVLPDGTEAVTAATVTSEAQDQISTGLGFLRTAFLVFAFVSLFVGAFIIFNTFAIIVAQRTRELALFRALGASGRQVMTSVVIEAVVIGLVSSALGVLFGIGIAILLKGALNAVGFEIPASGTVLLTRTFIVSIVVGTVVTVIAALVPARRAARVAPIEALREAQDRPRRSLRFRIVSGVVVLALGVAPLLYGLFGRPADALQFVGIGVALTFIGVAMLTPLIARPVAAGIGLPIRRTGVPGKLGRENSMRNPRRTAATASALMIGLGSRRVRRGVRSVGQGIDHRGPRAHAQGRLHLDLADVQRVQHLRGRGRASRAGGRDRVAGPAGGGQGRGRDRVRDGARPGDVRRRLGARGRRGSVADLGTPDTIAIHEDIAATEGWGIGDTVDVEWPSTGRGDLEVAVIYAENGLIGDWATSLDTYDANVAQELDLFVLIKAGMERTWRRSDRTSRMRSSRTRTSRSRTRPSSARCTPRSSTRC